MTVFFQTGQFCVLRKSLNSSFLNLLCLRSYAGIVLLFDNTIFILIQRWFRGYVYRSFSDSVRKWKRFSDVIVRRREEAQRSLVVQVNSESSFNELYGYCSKYATIKDIHHYRNFEKEVSFMH